MPAISTPRLTVACLLITGLLAACGRSAAPDDGQPIAAPDPAPTPAPAPESVALPLANGCAVLRNQDADAVVVATADGYALADADGEPVYLKPTGLTDAGDVSTMFHDTNARLLAADGETVTATDTPDATADWVAQGDDAGGYRILAVADGRALAAVDGALALVADASDPRTAFELVAADGCTPFPEAELGATGTPFSGTNDDGTVFGIADAHTHISAYQRLGGRVIHGDPFHRFGVTRALDDCAVDHGPQGNADAIGNFLRDGAPAGSHATDGWPTFSEWPVHDTYSHQQTYYIWVKRAWMAGVRLLMNHVSGDEQLCVLAPLKDAEADCDEMAQARRQIASMRELERYIDAQNGGPGAGWFRIVESPVEARSVIEAGKLAVILGIESSKLFGCGEFMDQVECNEADIDAGIAEFWDLGVRSVFVAHWFDNTYGGAGLFDQSELTLNALNKLETGHYYRVEDCPEPNMGANLQSFGQQLPPGNPVTDAINQAQALAVPTYGPGPHCNARKLTDLGAYLIDALADVGMIIETDHLGAAMKNQVLDQLAPRGYPVVAGHYHAGGISSPTQLDRIINTGGIAAPIKPQPESYPIKVAELRAVHDGDTYFGVPLSSDTGGLAAQPRAPRDDDARVAYPFMSYDGQVTFTAQVTGDTTFDYNTLGVAHYGQYADWINAIGQHPNGNVALDALFRSAEAYLRMWERTQAASE